MLEKIYVFQNVRWMRNIFTRLSFPRKKWYRQSSVKTFNSDLFWKETFRPKLNLARVKVTAVKKRVKRRIKRKWKKKRSCKLIIISLIFTYFKLCNDMTSQPITALIWIFKCLFVDIIFKLELVKIFIHLFFNDNFEIK